MNIPPYEEFPLHIPDQDKKCILWNIVCKKEARLHCSYCGVKPYLHEPIDVDAMVNFTDDTNEFVRYNNNVCQSLDIMVGQLHVCLKAHDTVTIPL